MLTPPLSIHEYINMVNCVARGASGNREHVMLLCVRIFVHITNDENGQSRIVEYI